MPLRLKFPVVLASASPRRQELLRTLVADFQVVAADLDEDQFHSDDPWQTAQILAREKAMLVFDSHPECLVIGGDTVVALPSGDGFTQLAKPSDAAHAKAMLRQLSGQTHSVITGIALRWPKGLHLFADRSEVTFRGLSDAEIDAYVATGQPMDKAGAYGLQDSSHSFIAKVEGSINNVIGLPTEMLEEALKQIG
jgi:septum formation protein